MSGFFAVGIVVGIALGPTLWRLRHRPAIRRRLRDEQRGRVYLSLSLNALLARPHDEWRLAEWLLRDMARREWVRAEWGRSEEGGEARQTE